MDPEQMARHLGLGALERRVRLAAGRAVLHRVDSAAKVQRLQAEFLKGEVRDSMEHFETYGFTSHPLAGMEPVAVFMGGDRSNGVVVAIADRQFRLTNLKPGEVALYDQWGRSLVFSADGGIIIDAAGTNVTINNAPTTTINGDVVVNGKVTVSGDVVAGDISLAHHRHDEVAGGNGTSGEPVT
jgi:phage baseplate assembly protein V